jgi:hypothetical protein
LFYPANSWGHKNHRKLLDGLVELRNRYGLEIPCVFTGHLMKGLPHHVDVPREIASRGLGKQVRHLGTVGLAELKYLYLQAAALIHPSLFESFGIPLVEAMSGGCPIIAADVGSLPEIGGDAALYFDPNDPIDIADKIHRFVERPDEVQERVAIGLARSSNFHDTKTAEETLAILDHAYRIAGMESLKARAADRRGQGTFLSMLMLFREPPEQEPIDEMQRLLEELPESIRVIALAPETLSERLAQSLPGKIPIRPLQGSLREAVSKASEDLAGE